MTTTDLDRSPGPDPARPRRRHPRPLLLAVAVAVAVTGVVVTVATLVGGPSPSGPPQPGPSVPTATAAPPITTGADARPSAEQPTASAPATPVPTGAGPAPTPGPVSAVTAVWPDAAAGVRYTDPVAAATGFARGLAGFRDPVPGPFLPGDGRSGEVEVRPRAGGPVTTVFVRILEDGTWWVLGSASGDLLLDVPGAGDLVGSPVLLQGRAVAFEGHVDVRIVEDGGTAPLAVGFATAGGDVLRPFAVTVALDRAPVAAHGAVVLSTASGEDGQVWQASVVRVRFVP
ncbi:Gmad2 immunoglobulin-like domain-containing protein [Pseudonocardia abyssalis]|uniref:Bacterial spore germination immunoglobulin-like domain-containing protein n=1 Tax=Pseudonocardia abyssalis TaxID=2792008 RepID=A0ABS6UNG4_9PSEU|nr:Gmad2 immunoglobulin-like domain-containing protein [Pseudonocardia abyssalis]MBW0118759.1 hypothetical protein [Pseudonocardia abyssalis]MBW0133788.1 hypothetical protein [Pseudonocardia abyssalis]